MSEGLRRERRAVVLVMDACGIGALPDAGEYGDEGTNTLAHLAEALGGLELPSLERLGLGAIAPIEGVTPRVGPGVYGRLHAQGPGKDSTAGHWELMGVVMGNPPPTYPEGFPRETVERLVAAMGHGVICNRAYNGIAAIEDFGAEHLRTGELILYTSQDSVLQLAAHVDRVGLEELYRACGAARAAMTGEDGVGRVIARPFTGGEGSFRRAEGRRDFALEPPSRSYLEELEGARSRVYGEGKVSDIFAGVGVSEVRPGASNAQALQSTRALLSEAPEGLIFVNLIETDQVYGHRKDFEGFYGALREIDGAVGDLLGDLREEDLLIVTADHGVDMAHAGTDHTREHAPLLAVSGAALRGPGWGVRHEGPLADVGATILRWLTGREARDLPGASFLDGEGRPVEAAQPENAPGQSGRGA
ncbi:MAG TPA: phosphopentomutase [Solirubrobacteraceae bacterium]|nr:phosphopentomutase [Solirubrobacteraceae bacterium]